MKRLALRTAMASTLALSACLSVDTTAEPLPIDTTTQPLTVAARPPAVPMTTPSAPVRFTAADDARVENEMRQQRAKLTQQAATTNFDALLAQIETTPEGTARRALISEYMVVAGHAEPGRAEIALANLQDTLEGAP